MLFFPTNSLFFLTKARNNQNTIHFDNGLDNTMQVQCWSCCGQELGLHLKFLSLEWFYNPVCHMQLYDLYTRDFQEIQKRKKKVNCTLHSTTDLLWHSGICWGWSVSLNHPFSFWPSRFSFILWKFTIENQLFFNDLESH